MEQTQQLLAILAQAHTQGQYHVLYANLRVVLALLQNPHFQKQLTLTANDLESIHRYLLTLGHAADEAIFRKELHEKLANPLYEIIAAINRKQGLSLQRIFREKIPWAGRTRFDFTPFHKELDKINDDAKTLRIQTLKDDLEKIQDFLPNLNNHNIQTPLHYFVSQSNVQTQSNHFFYQSLVNPFYVALKVLDEELAQTFQHTFKPEASWETLTQFDFSKFNKALNTIGVGKYDLKLGHIKREFNRQQDQRIADLKDDPQKYGFNVLELLVPYVKNLVGKYSASLTAAYIKQLLKFLESAWFIKQAQLPGHESLWHMLLPLQNTLDRDIIFNLFPTFATLKPNSDELNTFTYSEGILGLQAIAEYLKSANNLEHVLNYVEVAIALNERLQQLPLTQTDCALLNDQRLRLKNMRAVFETTSDSISAQKQFSADTLKFLNELLRASVNVLGELPCNMAFCALGSSSRMDRRPYSDIELVLLYHPPEHKKLSHEETQRITLYLHHLLGLMELTIVSLGESPIYSLHTKKVDAGFHLDSSCHILQKELFGTPHQIVTTHITEVIPTIDKTTDMQIHPWFNGESFYALLQPKLINDDNQYGSQDVIKRYYDKIQLFLDAMPMAEDEITALHRLLKLKTHVNLANFKRRQLIALSTLQHVLETSKDFFELKPGDTVDIKVAFYKPLAYLALSLKLFYDLEVDAAHPSDIFEVVSQQLNWGQTAVFKLFSHALAFIGQLQNTIHRLAKQQEEHIIWLGDANFEVPPYQILSSIEYAVLDLIQHSLIMPLAKNLASYFQKPGDTLKDVLTLLLKEHLNHREAWYEKWTQHPSHTITTFELFDHPLIKVLADYPGPNGWSPTYEQTMCRWLGQLQLLLYSKQSPCQIEGIPTLKQKPCYLPQEIVAQLFDTQGEFVGDGHLSTQRSKVKQITLTIPGQASPTIFYFKVKSGNEAGLMSREFAVINLHQLLGGPNHIVPGWPLKLTYTNDPIYKVFYCWVSEGMLGSSLTEVMQDEKTFANFQAELDMQSYSHLFITHYLTCPEDAQPENFKVVYPLDKSKAVLFGLDVGQSFIGTHDEKRKVLSVKTILYLLEPAIHQALDNCVLTRLILLEPQVFIKHWQANLMRMNQLFQPLFEAELKKTWVSEAEWSKYNALIDISENVQRCVQARLTLLLDWLGIAIKRKPTGLMLLKALEPAVALSYQSLLGKVKTPKDFYNIDPKAYVKNPYTGKMYSSTTYLQIQQQTLTPERLQASLNLGEDYFAAIDFRNLQDPQDQRYVLELLNAAINNKKRFTYLNLSGCKVLSEKELIDLLHKTSELKELYLEDCPQFNLSTLITFFSFKINERLINYLPPRWDYEVLCRNLRKLSITVKGKVEVLDIALTFEGRKQLLALTTQWQQQFRDYINKLLTKLNYWSNSFRALSRSSLRNLPQLKNVQAEELIYTLLANLGNKEWKWRDVRTMAVIQLGVLAKKLPDALVKDVTEKLLASLNDPSVTVRLAAWSSLGQLVVRLTYAQVHYVIIKLVATRDHWGKDFRNLDTNPVFAEYLPQSKKIMRMPWIISQEECSESLVYRELEQLATLLQLEDEKLSPIISELQRVIESQCFRYIYENVPDAQVKGVAEQLAALSDNDSEMQIVAMKSLANFFSTATSLQWLQRSLRKIDEATFKQLLESSAQIHQDIAFKLFSFLDQKTLLEIVLHVNKDWRRWQKVYLQQQAKLARSQHGLFITSNEPKIGSNGLAPRNFERFLKNSFEKPMTFTTMESNNQNTATRQTTKFSPIFFSSKQNLSKVDYDMIEAFPSNKPESLVTASAVKFINNHWYSDEDISRYLKAMLYQTWGGFRDIRSKLLNGPHHGQFMIANKLNHVAVFDAVDTIGQSTPIDYFIDKSQQVGPESQEQDDRHDVFDELEPLFRQNCNCNVIILFPYNQTQTHWLTGEINISKEANTYTINIYAHDPYAKQKTMEVNNFNILSTAIIRRIKSFNSNAVIIIENKPSPYGQRQADADGSSCGVIVCEDILLRIRDRNLVVNNQPYPAGTRELREKHLQVIQNHMNEALPPKPCL